MIKNLSKHSLINILNRINYLIGSLLFAYILSPNTYGSYIVVVTIISFSSIVIGMNLNQAYGRFLYENYGDNKTFVGQLILILIFILGIFYILNIYFNPLQKFNLINNSKIIPIIFILSFGQSIESLLIQHSIRFNHLNKAIYFYVFRSVFLSIISIIIMLFHKDIFIIFLLDSLFCIFGILFISKYLGIKFSLLNFKKNLKYIFSYALPLFPYTLSLIILSQSDRLIISKVSGVQYSAIYSFIYNFGLLLSFVFTSILNYFNNDFYDHMNSVKLDKVINQNDFIFKLMVLLSLSLIFAVSLFKSFIFPLQYVGVIKYLPLVVFTILIHGIWQIWARIIGFYKKTYLIAIISSISALISVFLNFIYIPIYGFEIAYFVNFISYTLLSVFAIFTIILIEKKLKIYDFKVILLVFPFLMAIILTFYFEGIMTILFGLICLVFFNYYRSDFNLVFKKL
jgi:O-antigen/teichoic acid export membrane protein